MSTIQSWKCWKKLQQHRSYFTEPFGVPNLLKMIWLQIWDIEDFISFTKSRRSQKSKFGAKSYGQNTTSDPVIHVLSGVHQTVRCSMFDAPSSKAPTATFNGTRGMYGAPLDSPVHRRKLQNWFPTTIFELGPIYISYNQSFEGVGAQATYQEKLYTFPSAQTPKCLIESLVD
jgi:hypothetical protein